MDKLTETALGLDNVSVTKVTHIPYNHVHEFAKWKAQWTVEKRYGDVDQWIAERMTGSMEPEVERTLLRQRYEVEVPVYEKVVADGNLLVNAGMDLIWDAVMGTAITAFSNANAYLGVGDSSTAAAAAQTDLQASSNKTRKAMNATYPDQPANSQIRFQSDFGSSDANYQWLEVGSFNASSSGTMLNRLVPSGGLGTKASGATWTLTLVITLS